MKNKIWIRKEISSRQKFLLGTLFVALFLSLWFFVTTAPTTEQRIISRNVLPNPVDIVKAFPGLIMGNGNEFVWQKSLFYAIWLSLKRELIAFMVVCATAIPLGIFMSTSNKARSFFTPMLIVGTFIPIAALIPLTMAFFGIEELQKVAFLALGMFFVLLALVIKEMDEVDDILLQTSFTLGFTQLQTVFRIIFPTALPRIWKHLSSVFGLGWGYIIFAEMIHTGGGDTVNGIGWLFLARQRRFQIEDMFSIFFVIILFAFLFSFLFQLIGKLLFRHERSS